MGTKSKVSEAQIQASIVELLTLAQNRTPILFFSIPNEALGRGGRNRAQNAIRMARFKKMGLLPGAADLVIVHQGEAYFLEVKTPTGRLTESQKVFASLAIECDCSYMVVRSAREAIEALHTWGIV